MGRRPGVRLYGALVFSTVAVVSAAITGLLIHRNVAAALDSPASELSAALGNGVLRAVVEGMLVAGGLAVLLTVPLALRMSRPLRRLNELADHLERGESMPASVSIGGSRELGQLGATLERLGATLRRQDEVRRDDGRRHRARGPQRARRRGRPRRGRAGWRHAARVGAPQHRGGRAPAGAPHRRRQPARRCAATRGAGLHPPRRSRLDRVRQCPRVRPALPHGRHRPRPRPRPRAAWTATPSGCRRSSTTSSATPCDTPIPVGA